MQVACLSRILFVCLTLFVVNDAKKNQCCANDVLHKSIKYQFDLMDENAGCGRASSGDEKAAFLARLEKHVSSLSLHSTLIFQTVLTNVGDGYNPSNGVFTSKRKGTYFFSWSTLTRAGNSFPTEIVLNGNQVGVKNHGYANSSINQPSTQNAVVSMQKGDKVWIRASTNNGYCFSDQWTTFSGFEI